jgi:hypothetical protein
LLAETLSWAGEIPDALGFKGNCSIVVERKISRSDFLADREKPFRRNPARGLGDHRYFLSPEGIITAQDELNGWGLLYLKKEKSKRIVCPITTRVEDFWHKGRMTNRTNWNKCPHIKNIEKELWFVISIARRLAQGCPHLAGKYLCGKNEMVR